MNTRIGFRSRRTGWSCYQVFACLIAAGVGVFLGAYYLGVPVENIAYTALDESKVLEKLPDEWRPETPAGLVKDPEQERQKAEQEAKKLQQELGDLQREVAELQTAKQAPAAASAATKTDPAPSSGEAQSTLEYWNSLRQIVAQVKQIDADSQQAVDALNAGRVLEIRASAYRFGTKAIDALPTSDVDPQAVAFGQSLINWYGKGVDLYETSLSVWRGELDGQNALGGTEGLAARQKQFEQQAALLRVAGTELSRRLARRLGIEFPPLGI